MTTADTDKLTALEGLLAKVEALGFPHQRWVKRSDVIALIAQDRGQ